jgi:hypothetical protein
MTELDCPSRSLFHAPEACGELIDELAEIVKKNGATALF